MKRSSVVVGLLLLACCGWSIRTSAGVVRAGTPQDGSLQASPADIEWFREARFGLFIHWGPVSQIGSEISWSRLGPGIEPPREKRAVPWEEYDSLYKTFNPTRFDAKKWVRIAKSAGMKYLVFTTKHHDGFCMFDTKATDYKITNSPFKRDIVAEIAKACHEEGVKLGFYYSQPDWHHRDYMTENHARYLEYMRAELRELLTNYGKVDILWFDGLGGTAKTWDAENLLKMIRELQPGILINNRAGLPADFDTPEQKIGAFQADRAWESCITIGTQWAYKPNDVVKSTQTCIQTLVRCAGGDGNLLLNVGPNSNGEIDPVQVERLNEIGEWLKSYGKSIYGTRGGPYLPSDWGVSAHQGKKIYLHVLEWKSDALKLPVIPRKVVKCYALTGGKPEMIQSADGIQITMPREKRDIADTIIVLQLDAEL